MTLENQSSEKLVAGGDAPETAAPEAERYRRQLEAACRNATVALFVMDGRRRCVYMNPAAEALTGYALGEVRGRPLHDIVHHTRPDGTAYPLEECPIDRALPRDDREQGEEVFVHRDGSFYTVAFTASPIREGEVADGTVVEVRGTAREKAAEEALAERTRTAMLSADIGLALTQGATIGDMLHRCTAAIVRCLDAAFARIWTLDAEEKVLVLRASSGMYTHTDGAHGRVPVGKFKIGLIAEERRPHLTNSVVGDPRVGDQEWAVREGMVSFAGYPLVIDDRLVGVMAMFARRTLPEATLDSMSTIANGIALGIERKLADDEREKLQQEVIRVQQSMLVEMSTPLIPIKDGIVVMPLIGTMNAERAAQMIEALLKGVTTSGARVAIVDITGVQTVDTHVANMLMRAALAVRLLGARIVITGIRAGVAQALVGLGVDLHSIVTRRNLQGGIEYAENILFGAAPERG